jgi:ferredoxin-NADP reductase
LTAIPSAPRRLAWHVATLTSARWETATARTLVFGVPGWPGHLAGQHVDVKLTAEDGYSAQRSYSIATPASRGDDPTVELTVQRLSDGEVSPYLTEVMESGDQVELRGPVGGWFAWDPAAGDAPLQLIAGGSGIVPLMAMIRAAQPRAQEPPSVPLRLLYSARTSADIIYRDDLAERALAPRFSLTYALTRAGGPAGPAEPGAPAPLAADGDRRGAASVWHGRVSSEVIAAATWRPAVAPSVFVCGPSGFVETASALLIAAGHAPATIRTERFGPT